MRARKNVLLYCADQMQLSVVTLVLDSTCRYAVSPCFTSSQIKSAMASSSADCFDAAIVMESVAGRDNRGESAVRLVKAVQPMCVVILDLIRPTVMTTIAERVLVHDMRQLLEYLRIATIRPRGPRGSRKALAAAAPGCDPVYEPTREMELG